MLEDSSKGYRIAIVDSKNKDFLNLIALLDADLEQRYGAIQQQYKKHNKVDYIKDVVLIYSDSSAVACGAFKEYDSSTVEIKRVFVMNEYRKQGLARKVLNNLEQQAQNKGYKYCVLETGVKQHEAIGLYKNHGHETIDNYGPYIGMENSICMKKEL
ncbi:MAG: acetyltransferase [Eubacterium sp.]|jgi:ribosomal protein S18 acetylase RimI-like enzyme|nr:acetyltransferase [Eubacterium sp.]